MQNFLVHNVFDLQWSQHVGVELWMDGGISDTRHYKLFNSALKFRTYLLWFVGNVQLGHLGYQFNRFNLKLIQCFIM